MTLMTVISQAQGGGLYASVAKALGLAANDTQQAMALLCPAIAAAMQTKANSDAAFADDLADLIADRADGGVIDDATAFTDGQSLIDGAALLTALYGSSDAALKVLPATPAIPAAKLPQLAALSAVAVVGAMAKAQEVASQAVGSNLAAASTSGGDLVSIIVSSLIRGAVQALLNKYLPRRRRYTDYFGRKRTTQRSATSPGLNDIFGAILGRIVRNAD